MRPFRFGLAMHSAASRREWTERAQSVESMGFDVLLISDHFRDQLAPFSALACAAAATTRLRLGTLVLDNDFRHPAITAKEVATLDVLSDGRAEVGLGAGWDAADYDRSGIPFDPPAIRVGRLEEGALIMRGLFGEGPFSFTGRHFQIHDLDGRPKPIQRPGPPILVGGGRPRMLAVAARVADIVGVHVILNGGGGRVQDGASMTGSATAQRIEWIRSAAPDRFAQLELQVQVFIVAIDRPRDEVVQEAEVRLGIPAAEVFDSPHVLAGSTDGIVEQLLARRERYGLSYVTTNHANGKPMARVIARLAGR